LVGRTGFSAGVFFARWFGIALAVMALAAPTFAQDLVITTERTTPISTSELSEDATLDVSESGGIVIEQEGAVVTVDTDNNVTVRDGGEITNTALNNAIGVYFDLASDRNSVLNFSGDLFVGQNNTEEAFGEKN
jgi:hypothetical protein